MKYLLLLSILLIFMAGCADNKVIDGVEYETYGLFDKSEIRNDSINYTLSMGNVIWGIILMKTVVAPIYFYGFSLWEPVSRKDLK